MVARYIIEIEDCGRRFPCPEDEGVLQAMERQGWQAIPVGCRNGGCGRCLIRVICGAFRTGLMSRRHVSEGQGAQGLALACRLYPQSDLTVRLATPHDRAATENENARGA
ncbi:ferredoxin [Oleomonas cavernae]|uniref:Ferredoxin n=1 Tax=Oleomonas cavernae TaxID=2320859 RepID=A0A418WG18_9PROT|nr:2Fe-2S iron-sulfur cluster binding domain-containing protein [Oleomonas cavernae]RJF88859.1 ferredoxin [Oleomonas cavernae]